MNCSACKKKTTSGQLTKEFRVICPDCQLTRHNKFDCKHVVRAGIVIVFVSEDCKHPEKTQGIILRQKCKDCKIYDRRQVK